MSGRLRLLPRRLRHFERAVDLFLPVYRIPVHRTPVHRIPVHRTPVCRIPVHRIPSEGFSLIELLVVLSIYGILMGAVVVSFTSQLRSHRQQETMSEMYQSARAAMELITREVRMAGYDPKDASIAGISYDPAALRLVSDLNGDGDATDANERIAYAHDPATLRLTRDTGGGRQSVAEHVEDFAFEYRDANGFPTLVSAEVRQIRLRITVRTAQADPRYADNEGYRTYRLESVITPPNLGL